MAFFSGATDMDALIDLIADQLIATGAWGTADGTLTAGAHPAKRAITHLTDTNFFVMFDRNLQANPAGQNANEIRVQISTGFNTGTHVPSGTIQTTGIPTEAANGGTNATANNKTGSHWTWVDASGVTLVSTWGATSLVDFTVMFTLERNTAKEYADGFTNFFCASIANANPFCGNGSSGGLYYGNRTGSAQQDWSRAMVVRPFNFVYYTTNGDPQADKGAMELFFGAYKSPGNSKVYFEFPFFSNNTTQLQRSPIAQTARFFYLAVPGNGMADGDLVTYVSGGTFTYLAKLLQSPDSTNYSPWAIRQA